MSFLRNRIAAGALLSVLLFLVGAIAGMFVGGAVTPKTAGLAGGAIVVGYGVMLGLGFVLVAVLLAAKLPVERLKSAVLAGVVMVGVAAVAIGVQAYLAQQGRAADAQVEESKRPRPVQPTAPVQP